MGSFAYNSGTQEEKVCREVEVSMATEEEFHLKFLKSCVGAGEMAQWVSTNCSPRGPRLSSQHTHGSLHLLVR